MQAHLSLLRPPSHCLSADAPFYELCKSCSPNSPRRCLCSYYPLIQCVCHNAALSGICKPSRYRKKNSVHFWCNPLCDWSGLSFPQFSGTYSQLSVLNMKPSKVFFSALSYLVSYSVLSEWFLTLFLSIRFLQNTLFCAEKLYLRRNKELLTK